MEDLKKTREVLNDLIKINNDRIEGYKKAVNELPDGNADLKVLFTGFIEQSEALKNELQRQPGIWDQEVAEETTAAGKIYRTWMGVKQAFATDDRKAVLESCEYGEDAAQKAYKDAQMEADIAQAARALINQQKNELLAAHDKVKHLRDQQ